MTPEFKDATRIHTALTAAYEKKLLLWLAGHTPRFIGADHLTALAFLAQIAAGCAYAYSAHIPHALWLVNLCIFLNWLGDSLDGTLARVRHQPRPRYGFYVDHIVDTLGALVLMTGLGCSGYLHWPIAIGLLLCFYVLSIESFLATHSIGRFHISHGFFGPTELRILLIAGNCALFHHKYSIVAGRRFLLFDLCGAAAIAGMSVMALLTIARRTVALYRLEPLP